MWLCAAGRAGQDTRQRGLHGCAAWLWQQARQAAAQRVAGHFRSAGVTNKRKLAEFRVTEDALLPVGTRITAAHFVPGQFVDVSGTTIGVPGALNAMRTVSLSCTVCLRR